MTEMRQVAPYPDILADLVGKVRYREGWTFDLKDIDRGQGSAGLTLIILVLTTDSYPPHSTIRVAHYMPVPPAAYDARSWQRWLFDQCVLVDRHEAAEFFEIGGVKPYPPHHFPGANPYTIFEVGTPEEADTDFQGSRGHGEDGA